MTKLGRPKIAKAQKKKSVGIRLSPSIIRKMKANKIKNISVFIEELIMRELDPGQLL